MNVATTSLSHTIDFRYPDSLLNDLSESISYLALSHGAAIGACLLLAATHIILLLRTKTARRRGTNLAVAVMATAAGIAVYFELLKVLSTDVDAYLAALYGEINATLILLVGLTVFTRFYFEHRIEWLFLLAITVWTATGLYQAAFFPESFYSEVEGLIALETSWGETYSKIDATVSGIKYTTDIGSLLILAYVSSTAILNFRRGNRKASAIVGGSVVGFMVVAGIMVPLDDAGLLRNTMPIGLPFLGIVLTLTYQLIDDQVRTNRLRLEVEQLRRSSLAGEIAAGLMHELRQPLTSILSNAQAATRFLDADDPDLDEVREALEDVISEDKRAAGIISGLRTFLSNEQPELAGFDLNQTIKSASNMLMGEFHTNGTQLELDLHSAPLSILASEVQVEQVLINLAMNAIRALQDTARSERVVLIASTLRDGKAEFSVADTGPGIADDKKSEVFEAFKSGNDGPGMGLAICRRIVDGHGGRIYVEDSDLGGARFVVVLPLTKET